MPHDKFGKVVEVGQEVIVRFRVTGVSQTEEYCNCNIESIEGMPPTGAKTSLGAINTKQVEVVKAADWRSADEPASTVVSPTGAVARAPEQPSFPGGAAK
jgi:hypothetical protein